MLRGRATRKKGAALVNALSQHRTCSIHALSKQWAEVNSYYRFLDNDRVTIQSLIARLGIQCGHNVENKSVIAIVDTTEINCQGHIDRLQRKTGLGPISDHRTLGYYLQPIFCLDAQNKMPLGLADVHLWNRMEEPLIDHKKRYITERESNKWYTPVKQAKETSLRDAEHCTFVLDREGDIYEVLEAIPDHKTDVVVRTNHNRIVLHDGVQKRLDSYLKGLPVKGKIIITLQAKKRSGERAEARIRYGQVEIPKPKNGKYLPDTSPTITMSIVEVEEVGSRPDKIHWRIWTSKPVNNLSEAKQIVDIYKSRWHIEELFRIMKTEAFDIESSELEKPQNLFKLGILVMEASVKIAQLKAVRDVESEIKVEAVFTPLEIECLQALDLDLKGSTEKQSNPFNPQSLSWASWIIARLGGWKGYKSQRPPGSITYKRGLERFYDFNEGFQIARLVYKR